MISLCNYCDRHTPADGSKWILNDLSKVEYQGTSGKACLQPSLQWHMLPRTCATARPQLAKADTAFQGASVGQPTEHCLGQDRQEVLTTLPLRYDRHSEKEPLLPEQVVMVVLPERRVVQEVPASASDGVSRASNTIRVASFTTVVVLPVVLARTRR